MADYRTYYLNAINKSVLAKANSCLFCDHCTDIFYDSVGIYALRCDIDKDDEKGCKGECEDFIEEKGEDDGNTDTK